MYVLFQFEDGIINKPNFAVHNRYDDIDLTQIARIRLVGVYLSRKFANDAKVDVEIKRMFEAKAPMDDDAMIGRVSATIFTPGTKGHREQGRMIDFKSHDWLETSDYTRLKLDRVELPDVPTDKRQLFEAMIPHPPDDGRLGRLEIDQDNHGNFI